MKATPPAKHGRRACLRRQSQARPEAQKSPPAILNFAKFKKSHTFSLLKTAGHGQRHTRRKLGKMVQFSLRFRVSEKQPNFARA